MDQLTLLKANSISEELGELKKQHALWERATELHKIELHTPAGTMYADCKHIPFSSIKDAALTSIFKAISAKEIEFEIL